MKNYFYISLIIVSALFASCKKDDWIDWKTQNEIWMAQNATRQEIQTKPTSGLQYEIIHIGNTTDTQPKDGSKVIFDYKMYLIDGNLIQQQDSFSAYCITGTETISGLISGMVEGLKEMHVGADFILYIPWELAYGESGTGIEGYSSFIPPYSALIYEIHLSKVYN